MFRSRELIKLEKKCLIENTTRKPSKVYIVSKYPEKILRILRLATSTVLTAKSK